MIMIDRNKLKAAARFAATDPKDRRETLHGVLVEASPAGVRLVATDGHALLVARAAGEPDTWTGIIPLEVVKAALAWKGNKVRKADIIVAKNYLTEDEIDTLNRLVVIFLETAELRAKSKQETRMVFWKQNVDQIITSNGFLLLTHAGSISHEQMEARTGELYLKFDQDRKKQEASQADQQDEADLKALETKLKRRPTK